MIEEAKFYVYQLRDPREKNPFYIGKGHGLRAWDHIRPGKATKNKHRLHKLESLKRDGVEVSIELIKTMLSEDDAFLWEIFFIQEYGRRDLQTGCLVNMTDGGEGVSGFRRSEAQREHQSRIYKQLCSSEKKRSELSIQAKGWWEIPGNKENRSLFYKNKWEDPEYREKMVVALRSRIDNKIPWESPSLTAESYLAWSLSDVIYDNIEIGGVSLARQLQISPVAACTINNIRYKFIKKGWNPYEDERWLQRFKLKKAPINIIGAETT